MLCFKMLAFFFFLQYFDMAADVMAENAHLTYKFLSPVRKTFKHFGTLFFIMTGCECAA